MTAERVAMIRERLTEALQPEDLDIQDDSAKHAGHEGAKGGGGHFNVRIVSPAFAGRNLLERHRMVYDALGDAMHSDIHALSIQAKTPEEL
ncbi:BolA family protein [Thiohalobacter thiocyanaticus]|uniref:BolA family transcriptional regulator n=1 Tax=Thiohalobacter thiocyanaticus TaxID=585455 RepID=A0A426QMH3_9GAMM|nr:BolA family protein [Thiohalobacter thiocyanaticus]RRQ22927.1 BolA family transcriptional regulator [Thiohalobacter thiocyanaticus]